MKINDIKPLIQSVVENNTKVTVPGRSSLGDYAFFSPDPDKEKKKLEENSKLMKVVDKVEVIGKFVNVFVKNDVLVDSLKYIDGDFGKSGLLSGKKYVVEFAHPNTHKAFHIGHLRNITTGESIARILDAVGTKIVRANYQGDVGLHIAKAIYGIKQNGLEDAGGVRGRASYLGEMYALGSKLFEEDENAKTDIVKINKSIYAKDDKEITELYGITRQWSLDYFDSIYERLGTKYDRFYFESEVATSGLEIAQKAEKEGVLIKSEGAVIFPGKKYGLHDRVFVTGEGVPTYEGKELGLSRLQFQEYNPDLIVHVVAPEQAGYFEVIFKALEFIQPETKGRQFHLQYGWVRLKKGKMSSRLGNVVLGEDLLDEAKKKIMKVHDTNSDIAEKIAVAAVKYAFLRTGLNQEIAFDVDESISLQGNSGPYIQYAYARAQSVLKKAVKSTREAQSMPLKEEELAVARHLLHFPEIVQEAAERFAPNLVCDYIYQLASKFNTFYNKHKIADNPQRVELTKATAQVLKIGLNLLGIEAPEKM